MDKFATFYTAFEIESKSTDTIFRELCQPSDYKKLNEGGWKEAMVNRYGEMMASAPNMRKLAARLINEGLTAKGYAGVDAEHVYFNTFIDGYKNSGDKAYRHNASQLEESYSLVDAAILDIFAQDWYNRWSELDNDRTNGIYSLGKEGPEWGPSNKLPFSSKVIADILYYDKNIANAYAGEFVTFWNKYADAYRDFLADGFMASSLVQYRARLLSEDSFQVLRHFYYSDYQNGCKVIKLDIYGYFASDIFCIYLGIERMLLYIPGANMPFREFVSLKEMKTWIAEQLRMPESRDAFARHFSLYDRTDGGTYYGVDSVLRFMAEGNSQWDPQTYILYNEQTYDLGSDVFGAIRNQIKARTESDKDQKPVINTTRYRDYVMTFGELFLSQVQMVSIILPQAPIPFNMDVSHTPLGLVSTLIVDTTRLSEPLQATGSRVDTDTFKALELLRICTLMANTLEKYSRPKSEIPAFASEQQAITARFGLTEAAQKALQPGDPLIFPLEGQPAQIRLVRLNNDTQPLGIIRIYAGNQYKLLDTLTLVDIDGQLVSAVSSETSGKTIYTANGYFRGYLPYQPYRFAFEYLWTPAQFLSSLGTLEGDIPQVLTTVYDRLERIHNAITLRQCQEAALELIEAIDAYTATEADALPYKETLVTVEMQVIKAIFPNGMTLLQESLLAELSVIGTKAAGYIYEAGIEEMAGENIELTATLLRYARRDNIVPIRSGGFKGMLTETLPYAPKYVITNLAEFNELSVRYYEQEPYISLGLTDNKSVFITALNATREKGLLDSCFIYNGIFYMGADYMELVHTISEWSCNQNTIFTLHPLIMLYMLQEISGNANDPGAGLMTKYAVADYYHFIADQRLRTMREVYHLTENFDFSAWDAAYGDSFAQAFDAKENETPQQAVQRQVGMLLAGKGCALPADTGGIGFFLNHLQEFVDAGVTCVGITSLYGEIVQEDIAYYLTEGAVTDRLDALLLTLDKGQANGPFRQLLQAVRSGSMSLLTLGQADGSVAEETNGYTHLYFRGSTLLNTLRQLPQTGKIVVFTHQYMMFSTPGINAPLPGLTQCLHIPGAWVDTTGTLRYYADSLGRSILIEEGEWSEADGEIWPVQEDTTDYARDLEHLMPEDGKVLGIKIFPLPEVGKPTIAEREELLKKTVSEADWPALKKDVDTIKKALKDLSTQEATSGSMVGFEVKHQLEILGYQMGNGVTLTWWIRGENDKYYSPYSHTAPTIIIGSNEYVIDAAHLQFKFYVDEGVIMLPVEDWAEEICCRAIALNPYLAYSMKTESELNLYTPFVFLVPRVPK